MRKQAVGILKLRRTSDKRRMLLAYCLGGLLISFAQVALSAEAVCVDNYTDAAQSSSPLITAALPIIKGHKFTNKSNGTHLRFATSDRIAVKTFSTSDSEETEFESQEGVIKICDVGGKFEITSVMSRSPAGVVFEGNCFRLTGLAALGGNRTVFCHGEIPPKIQAAYERDVAKRTIASQSTSKTNLGGAVQQ